MKKLILKTALITAVVAIVLTVLTFGILSMCAPGAMSRFSASIGLYGMSGDYAYSDYVQTGEIQSLAYSCEISFEREDPETAKRYAELLKHEKFTAYCQERDEALGENKYAVAGYRQFSYGNYAKALLWDKRGDEAIAFVLEKLGTTFPKGNCAIALAVEGLEKKDAQFCQKLATALKSVSFTEGQTECTEIITLLEDIEK